MIFQPDLPSAPTNESRAKNIAARDENSDGPDDAESMPRLTEAGLEAKKEGYDDGTDNAVRNLNKNVHVPRVDIRIRLAHVGRNH